MDEQELIAAQAPTVVFEESVTPFLTWPEQWPGLQDLIAWCQHMSPGVAFILLAGGFLFLSYGQQAHRLLMSINCMLIGAWIGGMLGKRGEAILPGIVLGGFVGLVAAWPLIRHSIMLLAAVVGFTVGSSLWRTFPELVPEYSWAGGGMGLIFLFMLSFITTRWTIILATGIQGSAMLIFGMLGLLYKYEVLVPRLDALLNMNHYVLPLAVLVPAILGWIYQQNIAAAAPPAKK
jgi:hypothetical protein